MSNTSTTERIDAVLALALTFGGGQGDAAAEGQEGPGGADGAGRLESALELFSAWAEEWRKPSLARAQWYAGLSPEKQEQWLAHVMARVRGEPARLDEHVHPSHIVEVLRDEPERVQELVLRNLPPVLAATCAAALHVERRGRAREAQSVARSGEAAPPAPELAALVWREFVARFVSAAELGRPTPTDSLTGVELARLVRLLGVRETAVACRGIESAEDVGSFLRRFSAEDASAIAKHINRLADVEPRRVAFAHQLMHEALSIDSEPEAMLDLLGMRLLAFALSKQTAARVAYAAQKIPAVASRALAEMISGSDGTDAEVVQQITRETEAIAHSLRSSRRQPTLPGAASAAVRTTKTTPRAKP